MLPDFLICGIQKGGTTSLHGYLQQHPGISMPDEKEVNFFTFNWDKGLSWYESHFPPSRSPNVKVGEASPLYMWYPEVPARIASVLPEAKLVFLLRNPVDRAYSNYWYNIGRAAQDPGQSFGEAVRTDDGRSRYITKGFYFEQLSRFARHFPRDRICVVLSEELFADPAGELRSLFDFIGVDPDFTPGTLDIRNKATVIRHPALGAAWTLYVRMRSLLKRIVPSPVRRVTRSLRTGIHGGMFRPGKVPPMEHSDRLYLQDVFAEQNRLLSDFLERNLTAWSKRP